MYIPAISRFAQLRSGLIPVKTTALRLVVTLALAATGSAQTKPSANPPPRSPATPAAPASSSGPVSPTAPATAPTTSTNATGDELVELSPFEVRTDRDTSYGALNSNSIARFNTELAKVPISADIFTEDFMRDVGVTTVEGLLGNYGAGTGMVLATPDSDANANQPGDRFSVSQIGVRGLSGGNIRRDGFEIGGTNVNDTDSAFIERVEVIRGPQGLLYGAGGAGGSITAGSKRARFSRNSTNISYQIDTYGSKRALLDVNAGTRNVAGRLVLLDAEKDHRRIFIGNTTKGYYGQLAFKLPLKTTLRVQGERTFNDRIVPANTGDLDLGTAAQDPRDNWSLQYILYQGAHLPGAINPATGLEYPRGAIMNGKLTWDNYASFMGHRAKEDVENNVIVLNADTVWTSWFSTNVAYAYNKTRSQRSSDSTGLLAPRLFGQERGVTPIANAENPFDSDWAAGSNFSDTMNASHSHSVRVAALLSKDFFSGKVKTQTAVGYDIDRRGSGATDYRYFLSDAQGNLIINPAALGTNLGRTEMPTRFWAVNNGPIKYPFETMGTPTIQGHDGRYWTRAVRNPRDPSYVSQFNPTGLASMAVVGSSGIVGVNNGLAGNHKSGYTETREVTGIYIANNTSWFSDRVETLVGYRETTTETKTPNTNVNIQRAYTITSKTNESYNLGVNVRALSWLRPYYGLSSTYNLQSGANDPYGNPPKTTEGFGQEFGIKFTPNQSKISGSIQYYWTDDKHQNYNAGGSFRDTVNPDGLNGRFEGVAGQNQWVSIDKVSSGLEAIVTANPVRPWRIRFAATQADGRVKTDKVYGLLYNDQFYVNSAGGVTYANGAPVLVPTDTAGLTRVRNLTAPVDPSTVIGPSGTNVTQLTTAMIGDQTSIWYAQRANQPASANGTIRKNNDTHVANVLRYFNSPGVGTPLTGVTGLPISAIQYPWTDPNNYQGRLIYALEGEGTVGYPQYKISVTNFYDFERGFLKGFTVGFTYNQSWDWRTYYYSDTNRNRFLFQQPEVGAQFELTLRYKRKFKRVEWATQLNVYNLFNHYKVGLQPSASTGFDNPANIGASFYSQPRYYAWTNSLAF